MTEPTTTYQLRCINLRCKSMEVFGEDFLEDPELQGENAEFWCIMTATGDGPDGEEVSMQCCTDPKRSCYKEY